MHTDSEPPAAKSSADPKPSHALDSGKPTVAVVGGGASAHVLLPLLAESGHAVRLLTRRPRTWSPTIDLELQSMDGEVIRSFAGSPETISDEPAEVISGADVVVLCMPVSKYRIALHQVAPHLDRDREVFVGTVYGQAGFNWMTGEIERKFDLGSISTFSVGLIPWICRVLDYLRRRVTPGATHVPLAALSRRSRVAALERGSVGSICGPEVGTGDFRQADSFLSLTLSVDNQIIHPARCYGLFQRYGGRWETAEDIPYFYRDFDELSASVLAAIDDEYSEVRGAIRARFPERGFEHMLDYLALERFAHRSGNTDIRESFTTSESLAAIKPPTRQRADGSWEIDTDHRFFTDDIAYGLCIAKWMAQELGVETPQIDAIVGWVGELRGERYIEGGRLLVEEARMTEGFRSGIPPAYGIETIDGIVD